MLGQIGLPGGGFGVGYGPVNLMGSPHPKYSGPTLPQGTNAVKEFLVKQGVPQASINTVSYGEERPVCREDSENCFQQNRRASFTPSS